MGRVCARPQYGSTAQHNTIGSPPHSRGHRGDDMKKLKRMSIEQQAATLGIEIKGGLTRKPERETSKRERVYIDAAGNEYYMWGSILAAVILANGGAV